MKKRNKRHPKNHWEPSTGSLHCWDDGSPTALLLKIQPPCSCFCWLSWSLIVHGNQLEGVDTAWKTSRQCCKHLNILWIFKLCTAQDDEELMAENVNTQKADSTHPLLGLCHACSGPLWAVVFFFFFLCSREAKKKEKKTYNSTFVDPAPQVYSAPALLPSSGPVFGQCFSDLHHYTMTKAVLFVFHSSCGKFHCRLFGGNPELQQLPSVRLRGCCSWCRFVWSRKLKEKNREEV